MGAGLPDVFRGEASGRQYALWFLAALIGFLVWNVFQWPIVAVDTDLWYHLNAGRYIAAHAALPTEAFFSFVKPTPEWLDYYWLSQLLFFETHAFTGEFGLVALRAFTVLGTLAGILICLRIGRGRDGLVYSAVVFCAVALFVLPRFAPIRPHDLSYLWIIVFLCVLESRRGLLLLPLLALLWVNLHGVEWPVMWLILGAYLGEWLLGWLGYDFGNEPPDYRRAIPVGVAMLCVLLTPHVLALLESPFTSLTFASQYIEELRPVDPWSLVSFQLDGLLLSRDTLLSGLLGLSIVAALVSLRPGALRPAHLVLLIGAVFLLFRIRRFSNEFVLLAVPILASLRFPSTALSWLPTPVRAGLLILLAILPFRYAHHYFDRECTFPVCARDLPSGAAAFLTHVNAQGRVLNHPNDGGFLQWKLPRMQVFVDLQTPFLFSDRDIFRADQAFQDRSVLAGVIAEYHPEFILSPRSLAVFGVFIEQYPEYVPVFVDDAGVLYANSNTQRVIARSYGLHALDPFRLELRDRAGGADAVARARAELERMNRIHPTAARTALFEGALALQSGDTATALRHGEQVIRFHPERPEGYRLRGDSLFATERWAEAAEAYEGMVARMGASQESQGYYVHSRLWSCYSRLERHDLAFDALKTAVKDLYSPLAGYRELYSLGNSAIELGRVDEGRTLLEFALAKVPANEPAWRQRITERLGSIPR